MKANEKLENERDEEIYGLTKAVEMYWETLSKQNVEDIIKRTHCIMGETTNSILINFLGEDYTVIFDEKTIKTSEGKQFFNLFIIGIILHYLVHAKDEPVKNQLISFRELWGGNEYYYAFNNRVLKPLTDYLKDKPELLLSFGEKSGGEKIEKGEFGVRIPALPRVPVTILAWSGDEEVEASANFLFDISANQQMETEGLVWLAVATVSELKKM